MQERGVAKKLIHYPALTHCRAHRERQFCNYKSQSPASRLMLAGLALPSSCSAKLMVKQSLHRSFSQEQPSFKHLNLFGHLSPSLPGHISQYCSLLNSTQLYQETWAKFILFLIDFSGVHLGPLWLSLSPAITMVNQHPERFPQLHFTLLIDNPRAQGLDSKAKA